MFSGVIEYVKGAIQDQIMDDPIWASVALLGQFVFFGRFALQWIASELKKKSHIPNAFWFMSLAGSTILLCYSIHIRNPIFVLGFSLNMLIYLRNVHLIYKKPARDSV